MKRILAGRVTQNSPPIQSLSLKNFPIASLTDLFILIARRAIVMTLKGENDTARTRN